MCRVLVASPEYYEIDFKITNSALLAVAQWALPHFRQAVQSHPSVTYKPTLLVTAGILHRHPIPELFSLSAVKAAQYSLVTSMYETFGKEGIHVALALVGGAVSSHARNLDPTNVAGVMWDLYAQDEANWSKEYEIDE